MTQLGHALEELTELNRHVWSSRRLSPGGIMVGGCGDASWGNYGSDADVCSKR